MSKKLDENEINLDWIHENKLNDLDKQHLELIFHSVMATIEWAFINLYYCKIRIPYIGIFKPNPYQINKHIGDVSKLQNHSKKVKTYRRRYWEFNFQRNRRGRPCKEKVKYL
jgi:hypothetical protein